MKIIGLTGGIASGKTSVANWFREKGVPVIDADEIAHELMEEQAVRTEISTEFGHHYLENGKINRRRLGDLVFRDPGAKKKLEAIIHPLVFARMAEKSSALKEKGHRFIIHDVPLLLEVGLDKSMDEVWVVYLTPELQRERLMIRNGFTREEAEIRIASQMPLTEKARKADLVIDNSGTWAETEKFLENIYNSKKL
jgi:dephospho-CoA kinase